MKEDYTDYYKNTGYNMVDYSIENIYLDSNFGKIFKNMDRNISILEIGSGQGRFANYCNYLGFKNYIGFDLDSDIVNFSKKRFLNYNFSDGDVFEYLDNNKDKIDIIFMSHVFEHFDLDEGKKLAKLIYNSLSVNGKWINSMPNGGNVYLGTYWRYYDITHKIIYTDNSFNQLLLESGFNKSYISHNNAVVGATFFKKLVHYMFIPFHKFLFLTIGIKFPTIYTSEIISIIKK